MDQDLYPPRTREPIHRPVMLQGWHDLTYVHWPIDPDFVRPRLPPGLEVDTFAGQAWVGLVAFHMQRIRPPFAPTVPYFGTFPETNVRTYVRGSDGTPGVWFDSLDVNRLLPVIVARASYRLPYMWSRMTISKNGRQVGYTARRRWPGPRGAESVLAIERGDRIRIPTALERFLTNRWGLFTTLRNRLAYAPVEHPSWPLEHARLVRLADELIEGAGYPAPMGEPLVHYSDGVGVRIGRPRIVES